MKYKIVWQLACLLIIFGSIVDIAKAQSNIFKKKSIIEWESLDEAILKAYKSNKMVLLAFHGTDCPYSKTMKSKVYSSPKVKHHLEKHFIASEIILDSNEKVNYKGVDILPEALANIFNVKGTPTLTFLNSEGDLIAYQPGLLEVDQLIQLLDYVGSGAYATISFQDFSKQFKQ